MDTQAMTYDSNGYLIVPDASLYYEVKGQGPTLILIPGANGDAVIFAPIRAFLSKNFRVVTYDRRGFSHSTLNDGYDFKDRLSDDADDVAALIAHLSDDGKAYVLGSSSGAIVALKTLLTHADKIELLVSHEPPAIELFGNKGNWGDFFRQVHKTYETEGMKAAMIEFVSGNIDEKDAAAMQNKDLDPNSQAAKNSKYWFDHELPVYPYTKWTTTDFKPYKNKLLLANGLDSESYFTTFANLNLSKDLGLSILSVPGGHLGYAFDPQPFSEILTSALLNK
ncbi:alpha/beta hydrolase [Deminuibacter soli]|uniref:Alpha/beta hydrolase n=1 Tax=Deminuibacter soli TaxID=2291815 RepID=A0A3E1NFW3_9BACT|nr:alpha/beta hydrolase [Deminuibacter soli]RFM26855.1 alpha/beta hydrolase [Deminuibacter soli]